MMHSMGRLPNLLAYSDLRNGPDNAKKYGRSEGELFVEGKKLPVSRAFKDGAWASTALLLAIVLPGQIATVAPAQTDSVGPLQLVLTIEQAVITDPAPARVTLLLHNTGKEPLWLYRRARPPRPRAAPVEEENRTPPTSGGATLTVKPEPEEVTDPKAVTTGAHGAVLDAVGLPRPKMVRVEPGEAYEEKTTLRVEPALDQAQKPIWGRYRLSVSYQASYSNGEDLQRILGGALWLGELTSAPVEVELRPAPDTAQGSITGTVMTADEQPVGGARVSLSDAQERLWNQQLTDFDGHFSFTHLPLGLYWLTARREGATEDTAVLRHVELTGGEPGSAPELVLLTTEVFEPRKVLHKPVLFLVTDSTGRPLGNIGLEITWSNGPLLDNVKSETGEDGIATAELIPGRNFVTLKRRGCPKQEERADVAGGIDGIDGFKLVSECEKK